MSAQNLFDASYFLTLGQPFKKFGRTAVKVHISVLGYSHNTWLGSSLDLLLIFERYLGNTKKIKTKDSFVIWVYMRIKLRAKLTYKLQVIYLNLQCHNLLSTSSPIVVPVCFSCFSASSWPSHSPASPINYQQYIYRSHSLSSFYQIVPCYVYPCIFQTLYFNQVHLPLFWLKNIQEGERSNLIWQYFLKYA